MRVLFITNNGVGLYSFRRELIEALLERCDQVGIAYPEDQRSDAFRNMGCEFISLPFDSASRNPFGDLKLFFDCFRTVKTFNPDVVMLYTIKPCIYAGLACQLLHKPYIATVTGISPAIISDNAVVRGVSRLLSKVGYGKANMVFFQNRYNEQLFEQLRIAKGIHRVINGSGVNLDRHTFYEYPPDDGSNSRFLYLGRVVKIKGIEELSLAVSKLKKIRPHVTCEVVGDIVDEELPAFQAAINSGDIIYHESVDHVDEYIARCNALVMPSYGEGMSNVMQEACACGRPVLASNIPGCKEIFDEEKSGYGFEPKSPESIYETLLRFCDLEYPSKAELGKNARKKVEAEFDRKLIVAQYIEEIEKAGKK